MFQITVGSSMFRDIFLVRTDDLPLDMATILEKLRQNAKINPGKRLFTFISPKISFSEGFA